MRIAPIKKKSSNQICVGDIVRVKERTMTHPTGGPQSSYAGLTGVVNKVEVNGDWNVYVVFSRNSSTTAYAGFMFSEVERVISG